MTEMTEAQAEDALRQLAQHLAHWRQSRPTPRGHRIPEPLWAEAITLAQILPLTRVAKRLGLKRQTLRRRVAAVQPAAASPCPPTPAFVEVKATAAWRSPTAEVEVQRADGARLRITYSEAAPALAPLLQTFLESR
jgi:hypothetical protein